MHRISRVQHTTLILVLLALAAMAAAAASQALAGKGVGGKGFVTSCADYQWAAAPEDFVKILTAPNVNYTFSVMEYNKPCDGPVHVTASIMWQFETAPSLDYAFEAECISGSCQAGTTLRAVLAAGSDNGVVQLAFLGTGFGLQTSTMTGTFPELNGNSTWKISLLLGNYTDEPMYFYGYHVAVQGFDKQPGAGAEQPRPTPTPDVPEPH